MKRLSLTFFFLGILIPVLWAQSPNGFSYQAVIRDTVGNPIENKTVSLRISILQGTSTGTEIYKETHISTTNKFGLVTIVVGGGSVVLGNFSSIDWGNVSCFIKTELDTAGGSNYVFMGTSQLLSVPYSLNARNGVPSGQNPGDMLYWNGSQWIGIPAGANGQVLTFSNGVPTWGGPNYPQSARMEYQA